MGNVTEQKKVKQRKRNHYIGFCVTEEERRINIYAADVETLRKCYDEIWSQAKLILRKLAEIT